MTSIEDVRTLIERGYYEEALEKIIELEEFLDKLDALRDLVSHIVQHKGPVEWIPDLIEDMEYISKRLKGHEDKAVGYGITASTLALAGYHSDAAEFFEKALREAKKIKDPVGKGEVLANIAYELAVAGYPEESLGIFDTAFDSVINAETNYRIKVEGVLRIGELMEKAGDTLPSKNAIKFYSMAFDIFDKLHVNQRAALVEKKMKLATTVYDVGLPQIRKALLEGRHHYTLALLEKIYDGTPLLIGALEIALWMKRVNNPEYVDVVEYAFEKCRNPRFTKANLQKIAKLLTDLGKLDMALEFAKRIEEPMSRSEAIRGIVLELAGLERFTEAKKIAELIPDPRIREQTMEEITAIEGGGR